MAVRHGYGKIAGTDALVFAYDTGDTRNSYKGRPTTNYGPVSFGSWGTENTAQRIATGNTYNGQPTYNCRTTLEASWQGIDTTISGLRTAAGSSGTVTMSCMVRNNNSTSYPMYAYIGHDFGSTRTIAANSDWQKVQWTVNQSSMNNDYVEFRPYTNTADVYLEMTMPMVEVNVTYASQFTTGTRSATQGLLDLTGNSTIDLTNVSFDSNAQITFDGTNDRVSNFNHNISSIEDCTVSMWLKDSVSTVAHRGPFWISDASSRMLFLDIRSDFNHFQINTETTANNRKASSNQSSLVNGQWHHVAVVRNGSSITGYIDGEAISLTQNNGYGGWGISTNDLSIGAFIDNGSIYSYWAGSIGRFEIYNRALTAAEVVNNYRLHKSRFNI